METVTLTQKKRRPIKNWSKSKGTGYSELEIEFVMKGFAGEQTLQILCQGLLSRNGGEQAI